VPPVTRPWNALWAMMVGFFMILVDSTIVAVANPSIMEHLQTDYDAVIWVTSAYLLAYAVPLLVAGRLGDQFGPKNLYLIGLVVFTAASLWCGLAGSIETLIAARVVQGIGAALLTPQTLSTITRIFPPERRGAAMSVWGATAGVATLVGPLAGGVLVDHLGWQWIFFVNVPIGVLGLALGYWLIPVLPTQRHRFDVLGVLLSGAAMFLVVFGLQEGESRQWPPWIWAMIATGAVLMAGFVFWQAVNKREPLIPLRIFRDRDFSLANVGVAVIGFCVTAMIVPLMFYAQVVSGLTPTRSALLTAPMAVMSGVLAPLVGKIVDRAHPRTVIGFGFSMLAIALTWLSIEMTPTTPIWRLLLPFLVMGVGMAFIWAPLAATATRNLPPDLAGAGSGVYNATRQVGSVLGSAGIAAFMTSRISAEMPGGQTRPPGQAAMELPEFLREPFSVALSQSVLLPAFVALFGVIASLFMVGMVRPVIARRVPARAGLAAAPRKAGAKPDPGDTGNAKAKAPTEIIPLLPDDTLFDSPYRREFASQPDLFGHIDYGKTPFGLGAHPEGYIDDDEDGYVEYLITLPVAPEIVGHPPAERAEPQVVAPGPDIEPDDEDTAPLATRVQHPPPAPVESWHGDSQPKPIGFAHNGFHVDGNRRFQPLPPQTRSVDARPGDGFDRLADRIDTFAASFTDLVDRHRKSLPFDMPEYGYAGHPGERPSRHGLPEDDDADGHSGRHYREDPEDSGYGRHSLPSHD
jgi:EmrB/QacA subfamily drug resistance transporter